MELIQDTIRDERRQQFFIVDNTVIDHYAAQIGVNGLAIYAVLVRMARDGSCFPSIPTIAKKLGIVDNTVKRTLAKLETAGLLQIERRTTTTPNGKERHLSNVYVLTNPQVPGCKFDPPPPVIVEVPGSNDDPPGSFHDLPPRSNGDPGGSNDDPGVGQILTPNNTKTNKTNRTKQDEEDATQTRASEPPSETSSPSASLVQELERTINVYGPGVAVAVRNYADKFTALGSTIIEQGINWRQDRPTAGLGSFRRWLDVEIRDLEAKARASPASPPAASPRKTFKVFGESPKKTA